MITKRCFMRYWTISSLVSYNLPLLNQITYELKPYLHTVAA